MLNWIIKCSCVFLYVGLCIITHAQADLYFIDDDDQNPIPGVVVRCGDDLVLVADGTGRVVIEKILFATSDSLCAEVKMLGYEDRKICFNQTTQTFRLNSRDQMLNAVVITAQHEQVRVDQSIHKMKVIDRKRMDQLAAINLEDVLMQELNMRIGQDAILGSGVSIQGLGSADVKILVDGVPIIGRVDGAIDLRQINLTRVERIEIIQGPLSVQFGTDAIAGTINIITKKSSQNNIDVNATTYVESVGSWNNSVNLMKQLGKFNIGIDALRNQFDGWIPGEDWTKTFGNWIADSSRYKTWKPRLQHIGSVRGGFKNDKNDLNLSFQLFDELIINRGLPRAPFQESAFDDSYRTKRSDMNLTFGRTWSPKWKSNQVFGYNQYTRIKNSRLTNLTDLSETLIATEGAQDTTKFDLWMSRGSAVYFPRGEKVSIEAGYDVNYEETKGRRIEGIDKSILDAAGFLTSQIVLPYHFQLKPALRYGHNSAYHMPVIPSMNVMWQKENTSLRASYARGFRAPSLKELYLFFVDVNHNIRGNTELEAENSDQFQLSVNRKSEFKGYFIRYDVTAFYNDVSNMITLAQVDNALYSYLNVGAVKTYGLSGELNVHRGSWRSTFALATTHRLQEDYSSKALQSIEGSVAIFWTSPNKKWNAQVFNRILGGMPNYLLKEDNTFELVKGDGYEMTDINMQYHFKRFDITLGVKNLFDVQNVNTIAGSSAHSGGSTQMQISTGRNYFASIRIHLSKK